MLPFIPWKWWPGTDHQPTLPKLACCQPALSRFLGGERNCPSIGSLPSSPGPLPPPLPHPPTHILVFSCLAWCTHSFRSTLRSCYFPSESLQPGDRITEVPFGQEDPWDSAVEVRGSTFSGASLSVFHSCWLLHGRPATWTCLRWLQGLSCLLSLGLCSCHCPGSFSLSQLLTFPPDAFASFISSLYLWDHFLFQADFPDPFLLGTHPTGLR